MARLMHVAQRLSSIACVLFALSTSSIANDFAAECRSLAGSPDEPDNPDLIGTNPEKINSLPAVSICLQAFNAEPKNTAVNYRLARAYMAPGPKQNVLGSLYLYRDVWNLAKNSDQIGDDARNWYISQSKAAISPETYKAAAETGDVSAQVALGLLHLSYPFLVQDTVLAESWLKKAAEQGHAEAQWRSGQFAEQRSDYEQARLWYELAAQQDHMNAFSSLSSLYKNGRGVLQSHTAAARWMDKFERAKRAAEVEPSRVAEAQPEKKSGTSDQLKTEQVPKPEQNATVTGDPGISENLRHVHKSLAGVLDGSTETHFNLPFENPVLYALGFEFLDELNARCPSLAPENLQNIRQVMFGTFTFYHFAFIQGEKLPAGTGFVEGSAALIGRIAEAGLPVVAARKAIGMSEPGRMAEAAVAAMGGCKTKTTERFISNLSAIAMFGRIRHRVKSVMPHYFREEVSEDGKVRACIYDDNAEDASEYVQAYRVISIENYARAISPYDLLVQNIENMKYPGLPANQPLMMRYECPATPDPKFRLTKQFVSPKEQVATNESGSVAERMANYFVDDYLSKVGPLETGVTPSLDADTKTRLKQEIINFESIQVTAAEVDRAIEAFIVAERERGFDATREPMLRLRQRFAGSMQATMYKEKFGTALFELAASPEARARGVPNYLAARDVPPLSDMIEQ